MTFIVSVKPNLINNEKKEKKIAPENIEARKNKMLF